VVPLLPALPRISTGHRVRNLEPQVRAKPLDELPEHLVFLAAEFEPRDPAVGTQSHSDSAALLILIVTVFMAVPKDRVTDHSANNFFAKAKGVRDRAG
jgi:hypothetical protein